ncbi:hypothetical protein BGZ46_002918 [Entomortierella lignicola]|nr:hypothetical protein BGZ46_002918 [Entomortierella lignicola]
MVWCHIETESSPWEKAFLAAAESGALKHHGQWVQSIMLSCYSDFIKSFLDLSPPTFPRLTTLSITNAESDSLHADFIGRVPNVGGSGLRTLDICGFEGFADFGNSSSDALLLHAPTLEVVRLDMAPCMDSKDIQQFLCSAPNLKVFDIVGIERDTDSEDLFLDAHDLASSDWICTQLEVFSCQIGGIPRPDITREIDGRPASEFVKSGTVQESMNLQRGVYRQLSRLSRLRELKLGTSIKHRWGFCDSINEQCRLYDCPAMSLKSGLGLLKDMRELEKVCLNDMEVGIGEEEEQAWVKENWPKVKRVSFD